jgi:hypothetical protein
MIFKMKWFRWEMKLTYLKFYLLKVLLPALRMAKRAAMAYIIRA